MSIKSQGFELTEHTADMGIHIWAPSLPQLFSESACALTSVITDLDSIKCSSAIEINVAGKDMENLMYNWLSEILYLFDGEQKIFKIFEVKIDQGKENIALHANVQGELFDKSRHKVNTYVKAITYHQLSVKKIDDTYEAKIFLDI